MFILLIYTSIGVRLVDFYILLDSKKEERKVGEGGIEGGRGREEGRKKEEKKSCRCVF